MKIERKNSQIIDLETFAEVQGLTMLVVERSRPPGDPMRFYAHFKCVETLDGRILSSESGNGSTEEEAITDYARRISYKHLVLDAYSKDRREFPCMGIVVYKSSKSLSCDSASSAPKSPPSIAAPKDEGECLKCGGVGEIPTYGGYPQKCRSCNGTGKVKV